MISLVGELGQFTIVRVTRLGRIFLVLSSAVAWAFRPPFRLQLIIKHMRRDHLTRISA